MRDKLKFTSKIIIVNLAVIFIAVLGIFIFSFTDKDGQSFALVDEVERETLNRIQSIRSTGNTDISDRTGNVFYVSLSGNDDNDGLSENTSWKSLDKITTAMSDGTINVGDTILLKDGDEFRGNITVTKDDITIGSYGDSSLGKPIINSSLYDGATTGEWTEVETNIWTYKVNGEDPFTTSIGAIWFFCDEGNDNCTESMSSIDQTFNYGQLITTYSTIDESVINIKYLISNDLEFYQYGHPHRNVDGGQIFVYSTSNPSERFDRIEFSNGVNAIRTSGYTNFHLDNVKIEFAGCHGISSGTTANLKVTNSEFGFIGGSVQHYGTESGKEWATRFGNAIEIYGSVDTYKGYEVEEGFVIDNCYVYQAYDAGLTFQVTSTKSTIMQRAVFQNNVVEYCNYNIEYWNYSSSTDETVQDNTYIKYYSINDNIFRYAGYGLCRTRPDKTQSGHIKSWAHGSTNDNKLNGTYVIKNNIFDEAYERAFWIVAGREEDLPTIENNTFYDSVTHKLGYVYAGTKFYSGSSDKIDYPYYQSILNDSFPNNTFNYTDADLLKDYEHVSGTTGDVTWTFDLDDGSLEISGSGAMADYDTSNLPPWYIGQNYIRKIIIGENITHLGTAAFYDLPYVDEIIINSVKLDDLAKSATNMGSNYTFYKTGASWKGITVTFGENVTYIPAMLFWPYQNSSANAPNVKKIEFLGNKIEKIGDHALSGFKGDVLVIPEGVTTLESGLTLGNGTTKLIVLPNSLTKISGWSVASNSSLETVLFGNNVSKIEGNMFYSDSNLKTVVIPGSPEYNISYSTMFSSTAITTIYGNESVNEFVNNYTSSTSDTNKTYKSLDEYNINVTSNAVLYNTSDIKYNESYEFSVVVPEGYYIKNVTVNYQYTASNGITYDIISEELKSDSNTFKIDNLRLDAVIDVEFENNKSRVNSLSNIIINDGNININFDENKNSYAFNVPYENSTINIKPVKVDDKSTLSYKVNYITVNDISNAKLDVGSNEIEIDVISESGDKHVYTVYVSRLEEVKTTTTKYVQQTTTNNTTTSTQTTTSSRVIETTTSSSSLTTNSTTTSSSTSTTSISTETSTSSSSIPSPSPKTDNESITEESNSNTIIIVCVAIGLSVAGGGVALYFLKFKKK